MKLKKDYFEDIRLFDNWVSLGWALALIAGLFLLPLWVKSYYLTIIKQMAVYGIVGLGLNLLVGNTGQISLGHAGFVVIGAYTAIFLMQLGIPFYLAFIGGGFVAAVFGALLGLPSLRLEGPYLAIATLAFGMAVVTIIGRIKAFGGRAGISVPKSAKMGMTGKEFDMLMYYVILVVVLLMILCTRNLIKSRLGRAFQAIRDSDIAASAIGINLAWFKTLSFSISAFYAGLAGGLWALYLGFISPNEFNFVLSATFLAMIVMGGLGSVTGSIMGAIVIIFLKLQLDKVVEVAWIGPALESFSKSFMTHSGITNISWVFMGLILIFIIIFEPLGLYGIWLRVKLYWKRWPF